jgi:hypothetical protein
MRIETQIVQRVTRAMDCSECGVEAAAACDCGAPYIPAGVAAAKAVTAHPEKSDRAIAAEIGVSDKTVGKARRATAESSAVKARVGLDGIARKQPAKRKRGKRLVSTEESVAKMRAQMEAEEASLEAEIDRLIARLDRELAGAPLGFFGRLGHIHAGWHLQRALVRLLPDSAPAEADIIKCDSGEYHVMVDCCTTLGSYPSYDAALAAYQHYQRNPEAFTRVGKTAPVENAPPPDVSADKMKAAFAKIIEDEAALTGWDASS